MNKFDWYFDDLVGEEQLDRFTEDIEMADRELAVAIYGFGLVDAWEDSGGTPVEIRVVTAQDPPAMAVNIAGPHYCYDRGGRHIPWSEPVTSFSVTLDWENTDIKSGLSAGKGRWVSIFAVADRDPSEDTVDGNGLPVSFRLDESALFIAVRGPIVDLVGEVGGTMPTPALVDFPAAPASTADYPYADAIRLDTFGIRFQDTTIVAGAITSEFRDDWFRHDGIVSGSIKAVVEKLYTTLIADVDWTEILAPADIPGGYPAWADAVLLNPGADAAVRDIVYAMVTELACKSTTLASTWAASWFGGEATHEQTTAHEIDIGQTVVISGYAVHAGYNGTFIVKDKTVDAITVDLAQDPGGSDTNGTVTPATGAHHVGVGDYAGIADGIPWTAGTLMAALKTLSDGMSVHRLEAPAHEADQIFLDDEANPPHGVYFFNNDLYLAILELLAAYQPHHVTGLESINSMSLGATWSAAWGGGVATYTNASPHGIVAGQTVVITGFAVHTGYNGRYVVVSKNATQFTINIADPGGTDSGGSVEPNVYYGETAGNHKPIVMINPQVTAHFVKCWESGWGNVSPKGAQQRIYSYCNTAAKTGNFIITVNAQWIPDVSKWQKDVAGGVAGYFDFGTDSEGRMKMKQRAAADDANWIHSDWVDAPIPRTEVGVRARKTTDNQSITQAQYVQVLFETEDWDMPTGCFSGSTFTANRAMTVRVSTQVLWDLTIGSGFAYLYLYKQGSAYALLDATAQPASGLLMQKGEAQVTLAAGETISIYVSQTAVGAQPIRSITGNIPATFLDISEVNGV